MKASIFGTFLVAVSIALAGCEAINSDYIAMNHRPERPRECRRCGQFSTSYRWLVMSSPNGNKTILPGICAINSNTAPRKKVKQVKRETKKEKRETKKEKRDNAKNLTPHSKKVI